MAESAIYLADQHIAQKIRQGSKALSKIKVDVDDLLSKLKDVNKLYGTETNKSYEVRRGIGELTRIAYAAEDEVDLLVSNPSPLFFLGFGVNEVSKKLRKLKEQTREVKDKLGRQAEGENKPTPRARGSQDPQGYLPAEGDLIIGIGHEIKKVIDQFTGNFKSNDPQPLVDRLAIVGMGGSGKTTLARSIYNHKTIKRYFNFQAWVSGTQGWDMSVVLSSILKQVRTGKWRFFTLPDNDGELPQEPNKLASRLNDHMYRRNCLLVLDDVRDMQSLNQFIALIQKDELDSCAYTIVITSRRSPLNQECWRIHQPQRLTEEDNWKLFSMVASKSSKPLTVEYHSLAKQMLRTYQGLPLLAIVALGRLLKTKETKQEWKRVLSQITGTNSTTMYGPVNEILGLSYDELPCYLKPCFLYLGLFPQGSAISGGPLIRMWIAEGFITSRANEEETLEEGGRRYLQELVEDNMIDVVSKNSTGKVKTIRLHEIMRNFCLLKAKERDFLSVFSSEDDAIEKTPRRASINNPSNSIMLPDNNLRLRSLALLGKSTSEAPERYTSPVNQRYLDLDKVCQMYKLLRVLDIFGINSRDGTLPKEIGNLIHLTYLRIRTTNIRQLPKSIGKLRNLLTLDYWDVSVDTEIYVPNVLWKLKKLRHLYLPNSSMIKDLKLHTLKDLITLWGIGGGQWIPGEMDRFRSTLSKLYIHGISTEDQLKAVLSCPSMEENGSLYALALEWYGFEFKNFDELLSKQTLIKLRLTGKAPDRLPAKGLEFPPNLGKLELSYTQLGKLETMEALGRLTVLKVLKLSKDSYIGSEWSCKKGSFPVLEELKLANLPKLENWELEEGAMPCLKKLSLVSCIHLKRIPEGLKLVKSLEELNIERMSPTFQM